MPFCVGCGVKCSDADRFCGSCGARIVAAEKPAPAAAPTQAVQRPGRDVVASAGCGCGKCGKPIEASDSWAISAMGRKWHKECFNCSQCGERLFSMSRFFEGPGGMPVCAKCTKATNAPICASCHKKIEGPCTVHSGKSFHTDTCFKCSGCGQKLGDDDCFEDRGQLWHLLCAGTK